MRDEILNPPQGGLGGEMSEPMEDELEAKKQTTIQPSMQSRISHKVPHVEE
jgi:hypothetical protein